MEVSYLDEGTLARERLRTTGLNLLIPEGIIQKHIMLYYTFYVYKQKKKKFLK